jgi:hypothetical protein
MFNFNLLFFYFIFYLECPIYGMSADTFNRLMVLKKKIKLNQIFNFNYMTFLSFEFIFFLIFYYFLG